MYVCVFKLILIQSGLAIDCSLINSLKIVEHLHNSTESKTSHNDDDQDNNNNNNNNNQTALAL